MDIPVQFTRPNCLPLKKCILSFQSFRVYTSRFPDRKTISPLLTTSNDSSFFMSHLIQLPCFYFTAFVQALSYVNPNYHSLKPKRSTSFTFMICHSQIFIILRELLNSGKRQRLIKLNIQQSVRKKS